MSNEARRVPRLLVLTSTYPRWQGDSEPGFVHELAKRLVGDFDVTVLCPHATGAAREELLDRVRVHRYCYAPKRLETLVNNGGIITNLRRHPWKWLLVPGFLLSMLWSTWTAVRRYRPDVIHAHWLIPQGLIVAFLQLVQRRVPPFIVTSHGADLFALKAAPLQAIKRFVADRAAAITVVSRAMRDELLRMGVDITSVSVQPMGVDLAERFTPDALIERSRDEILFVGRMVEKKGLRHLIAAMPMILEAWPSAFLTVAGFGPEEAERRLQVRVLGLETKIRFIGALPQAQLPEVYRRAAVFVAPFVRASGGDEEGLGLVLVEAAGCGCPLVVGDVAAVRDVIQPSGVCRIVDPRDARSLATNVCAVLASPQTESATAGHVQAVQHFDWRQRAAAYAALLAAKVTA